MPPGLGDVIFSAFKFKFGKTIQPVDSPYTVTRTVPVSSVARVIGEVHVQRKLVVLNVNR